ncbi:MULTISPECIES: AzlC family ABC transporter permease [Bacillus]|uniref:4-azaleucine resistance transporter AzlC n=1 Tax=Bacillus mycoides TaxID=1405 RepID=A0A3D9VE82_BACMY|nr:MULTISPECIES: AzlC family ABC transporter permease [Bacillus]RBP30146.1 4-azaleucine resistance transporter AzlC [Bacillus sp. DB-2]REF39789.1 4-azaleucine resistance transporter AzlC [Bacillus mycoides]
MKGKQLDLKNGDWVKGILDVLPMGISFTMFGSIFGVMAIQTGLTPIESLLMSLISFAGSAQLSVLPMLQEHASVYSMILTTFLINARHLLYGLSLSPFFSSFDRKFNNFIAYFLSDALYALSLTHCREGHYKKGYIVSAGLFIYITWGLGTLLGTIFGTLIPNNGNLGLEFSITIIFLIMSYKEITSLLKFAVFLVTGLVVLSLSSVLPMGVLILFAGGFCFSIGYFLAGSSPVREE